MRPRRLELTGFASYSQPTEVNFDGADLFVFTGPTGSGKSSLVDAITFALYGTVPRYDHKGMVAPVITQGKQEAKVRLDFQVGGQEYTAVPGRPAAERRRSHHQRGQTRAGRGDSCRQRRRADPKSHQPARAQLRTLRQVRGASPGGLCPVLARQTVQAPGIAGETARYRDLPPAGPQSPRPPRRQPGQGGLDAPAAGAGVPTCDRQRSAAGSRTPGRSGRTSAASPAGPTPAEGTGENPGSRPLGGQGHRRAKSTA